MQTAQPLNEQFLTHGALFFLQVAFLDAHREQKVIVYFLTCACVELYALLLKRLPVLKGLQVSALHGKLKQVSPLVCWCYC
jgi:hypothetical protein